MDLRLDRSQSIYVAGHRGLVDPPSGDTLMHRVSPHSSGLPLPRSNCAIARPLCKINNLGWKATVSLRDCITSTYKWFLDNRAAMLG